MKPFSRSALVALVAVSSLGLSAATQASTAASLASSAAWAAKGRSGLRRNRSHSLAAEPLWVDQQNGVVGKDEKKEEKNPWTTSEPDSTDYNPETKIEGFPFTVETTIAGVFCLLLASTPLLLASLADKQLTRAHMLESVTLIAWLGSVLWMFTCVLKFQSVHWDGYRPLTIVEAVYLLSQIITTVGYGDITPAFPRGQVWVGINVILALCLYGSIVCEVIAIVHERLSHVFAAESVGRIPHQPMKDWHAELFVCFQPLRKSFLSFIALATVGVMFWHYYPGEEKTWLQAVYMSIITLSTVGFGAFTAVTEGGKVFGAFWMLCGVATLGALISTFIESMVRQKHAEAKRRMDLVGDFKTRMAQCNGGSKDLNKEQFLKFALMLTKNIEAHDLNLIEARFSTLVAQEKESALRRTRLVDIEGPVL